MEEENKTQVIENNQEQNLNVNECKIRLSQECEVCLRVCEDQYCDDCAYATKQFSAIRPIKSSLTGLAVGISVGGIILMSGVELLTGGFIALMSVGVAAASFF